MKADRYSNTGKYYRTDKKRKNGGIRRTAAAVLALTLAFSAPASAAGWEQEEETWYYLDDDGVRQTGWVQTENGRWYELDETGAWIEHPALTDETAGYLLSNALMDAGWYQNESRELEFVVNDSTKNMIQVAVGYETKPEVFWTINTFRIDRKTGEAKPFVGDVVFRLK